MLRYGFNTREVLNVKDVNNFRRFEYVNEPNDSCQVGAVIFKESTKEIGVVTQTFGDGTFNTDKFQARQLGEVRFATKEEVMRYRKELVSEIWSL